MLKAVDEAVIQMQEKQSVFSEADKEFVTQFAFHTQDGELTGKLIEELWEDEKDHEDIRKRYGTMLAGRENYDWVEKVENLLVALETYLLEEKAAMDKVAAVLDSYGISPQMEETQKVR